MASVRSWADESRFDYRFVDDELFLLVPQWYRAKAGRFLTVVTDLARLVLGRDCLLEGFDRYIWVDCDVLIFKPESLKIDSRLQYAFCREIWMINQNGSYASERKVNNAVCMFQKDAMSALELYISGCKQMLEGLPVVRDQLEVGTRLLTNINRTVRALPLLDHIGLLSPDTIEAILRGDDRLLDAFMREYATPLYALNLCHYFRATRERPEGISDETFSRVIAMLLESKGDSLNRFLL